MRHRIARSDSCHPNCPRAEISRSRTIARSILCVPLRPTALLAYMSPSRCMVCKFPHCRTAGRENPCSADRRYDFSQRSSGLRTARRSSMRRTIASSIGPAGAPFRQALPLRLTSKSQHSACLGGLPAQPRRHFICDDSREVFEYRLAHGWVSRGRRRPTQARDRGFSRYRSAQERPVALRKTKVESMNRATVSSCSARAVLKEPEPLEWAACRSLRSRASSSAGQSRPRTLRPSTEASAARIGRHRHDLRLRAAVSLSRLTALTLAIPVVAGGFVSCGAPQLSLRNLESALADAALALAPWVGHGGPSPQQEGGVAPFLDRCTDGLWAASPTSSARASRSSSITPRISSPRC